MDQPLRMAGGRAGRWSRPDVTRHRPAHRHLRLPEAAQHPAGDAPQAPWIADNRNRLPSSSWPHDGEAALVAFGPWARPARTPPGHVPEAQIRHRETPHRDIQAPIHSARVEDRADGPRAGAGIGRRRSGGTRATVSRFCSLEVRAASWSSTLATVSAVSAIPYRSRQVVASGTVQVQARHGLAVAGVRHGGGQAGGCCRCLFFEELRRDSNHGSSPRQGQYRPYFPLITRRPTL